MEMLSSMNLPIPILLDMSIIREQTSIRIAGVVGIDYFHIRILEDPDREMVRSRVET